MIELLQSLATFAAGIWTGAAIYIGLVEHPSSRKLGDAFAIQYFRKMSKRTAPMMMFLSGTSGISASLTWYLGGDSAWLVGGLVQLSMFPLTALLIVPTNIKLIRIDPNENPQESADLMTKWCSMHWFRTTIGAASFPLFIYLLNI